MENNETQFENLENLTNEQLEAEIERIDADDSSPSIDWQQKARDAEKRAAMLQRLLNKKDKPTNKTNLNDSISNDIAEVKKQLSEQAQILKVQNLADQTGYSKEQIKKVLEKFPTANAELILDPIISTYLQEEKRKETFKANMPGAGTIATVEGKSFSQMSKAEREANFQKIVQG